MSLPLFQNDIITCTDCGKIIRETGAGETCKDCIAANEWANLLLDTNDTIEELPDNIPAEVLSRVKKILGYEEP